MAAPAVFSGTSLNPHTVSQHCSTSIGTEAAAPAAFTIIWYASLYLKSIPGSRFIYGVIKVSLQGESHINSPVSCKPFFLYVITKFHYGSTPL